MKELEKYCQELEIKDFKNELKIASEGDIASEYFFHTIYDFAKKEADKEIKALKKNIEEMKLKLGCKNCIHCDTSTDIPECVCGFETDARFCNRFSVGGDFIEPTEITEKEFYR